MSKNWYPVIDKEKCINCGICLEKCKKSVYDGIKIILTSYPPQDGGWENIRVVYPDNCVEGCTGCSKLCPKDAITYEDNRNKKEGSECSENKSDCTCGGNCGNDKRV